jgi:hypothetical protein
MGTLLAQGTHYHLRTIFVYPTRILSLPAVLQTPNEGEWP